MTTIHACHPVFAVSDPPAAAEHYVRILGFEFVEEPIEDYAQVRLGAFEVHFHRVREVPRVVTPDEPYRGGAYFLVEDPDALHREMVVRGAEVVHAPADRPYGRRDFTVVDPEGYSLCFGKHL